MAMNSIDSLRYERGHVVCKAWRGARPRQAMRMGWVRLSVDGQTNRQGVDWVTIGRFERPV
jgi:hypothetical protein